MLSRLQSQVLISETAIFISLGGTAVSHAFTGTLILCRQKSGKQEQQFLCELIAENKGSTPSNQMGKIGTNDRNKDDTPSRRIEGNRDISPLQIHEKKETAVLCYKSGKQAQQSFADKYLETRTAVLCKQKADAMTSVLCKRKPETRTQSQKSIPLQMTSKGQGP